VKEIDVQVELTSRLARVYDLIGRGTFVATYADPLVPGVEQRWPRVACEPYARIGEGGWAFPDVVVQDDCADPANPPDAVDSGIYPLLWACEVKFRNTIEPDSGDLQKLHSLVDAGHLKFGCVLSMSMERSRSGDGLVWGDREKNVWTLGAELPPEDGA